MVNIFKRRLTNRTDAIFLLGITLAILLLLNVLSQLFYTRFDLTSEKKYSLTPATKKMVRDLKNPVTFKIYLEGDMPAGFKQLRQSTRDLLAELRAYGGRKIEFEFIDPVTNRSADERKAIMEELLSKGLAPANVQTGKANEQKLTMVFPCAIAYYGEREFPIQLLENQIGYSQEQVLNNSSVSLEYKFANAIQKLTQFRSPRVAFSNGNGELSPLQLADLQDQLVKLRYDLTNIDLNKTYKVDSRFDALVIAKPTLPFTEKEKYQIDQYVMRGGKVLWLIDATTADMDSLKINLAQQMVVDRDLNLDDQLFKYGVRLNTDLVQDITMCNPIPLVVGQMGSAPQTELLPWYYFPLLVPDSRHPIVRNLDPVAAQFTGTIDTIRNADVNKTILLRTSDNSKAQLTPIRVHFGILQQRPNPVYYNQQKLPVAALLEGKFASLYTNRMSPEFLAMSDTVADLKFKEKSVDTKMIVIADGDIARNEVRRDSTAYPLGYYGFTRQTFANRDFMLNCIQYLVDKSGILETRNKEVKLRLLNTIRVENEKVYWQLVNVAVPILIVVLSGIGFAWWRRRRFAPKGL
ncbi:MAG: gliding motility-associated ABC transporter substrate-binding protein GldG [Chitinophagales bacterium]